MARPTTLTVDLTALVHNLGLVREKVGPRVAILAVVKANAYGLGSVPVAAHLERAGADGFCVATGEEGIELRTNGITRPILVLGGLYPGEGEAAKEYGLTPAVYSLPNIALTAAEARAAGAVFDVHLKVETGMNRLGVRPDAVGEAARVIRKSGSLRLAGIFSHLAESDADFSDVTRAQIARFEAALAGLDRLGERPGLVHLAASGGILASRDGQGIFGGVRPGILLYGSVPDAKLAGAADVRPVTTLASRIVQLRRLSIGERVSYSGTFVAQRETTMAVLPAGYADGVPRALSNLGCVLVRGRRAPILGRVCMDLTIVDVTDVPDAAEGDEAVFFGMQGGALLPVEEVAEKAGTISYEILTGIGPRVPRVYVGSRL